MPQGAALADGEAARAGAADPGALEALIARVANGDLAALEAVYRATSAKLYGVVFRILRDSSDAEDVLHDIYVSLWRRAQSYDEAHGRAIAWLTTVARNRAIDRLRSRRHSQPADPVDGLDLPYDGPSGFDSVSAAEDRSRLQTCLEQLDERSRSAIRTAFWEGATYEQLAIRWDVPLGTMKSWIRRGMIRLRGCLDE